MTSQKVVKRAVAVLGVLAVSGLSAAGCGGGSGDASASSSELTKPQFVKQATGLCRKESEEKEARLVAAVKGEGGKGLMASSESELEKLTSQVVLPLYGETIDQLRRLKPPAKDKARVAKIMGEFEAALEKAEADPLAAVENNPFLKGNKAAAAYGFACSF